jgi:hypothetical protein
VSRIGRQGLDEADVGGIDGQDVLVEPAVDQVLGAIGYLVQGQVARFVVQLAQQAAELMVVQSVLVEAGITQRGKHRLFVLQVCIGVLDKPGQGMHHANLVALAAKRGRHVEQFLVLAVNDREAGDDGLRPVRLGVLHVRVPEVQPGSGIGIMVTLPVAA